jgi:hypothetical protein
VVCQAAEGAADRDAQAVAALALDRANIDLETVEALERQLLGMIAGFDGYGVGLGSETVVDDPEVIASLERMGNSSMPIVRPVDDPQTTRPTNPAVPKKSPV